MINIVKYKSNGVPEVCVSLESDWIPLRRSLDLQLFDLDRKVNVLSSLAIFAQTPHWIEEGTSDLNFEMSSPADTQRRLAAYSNHCCNFVFGLKFYNSLPPISKAYGTICLLTTALCQLGILDPYYIYLLYPRVLKNLQIWRLITPFFFLGKFSINFGIRLLMIARYGVQLENGPFDKRTADFLWMMIFGAVSLLGLSAIPYLWSPLLGPSMVSMLVYLWSREFPNAQINIYGLVNMKAFYFPWVMLALDMIFGSPLLPNLLGIVVGHLYYFFSVLYPLKTGRNPLKTPLWLQRLVVQWRLGAQRTAGASRPVRDNTSTGTGAFRGRAYRLDR
ncbi:derlin-1-like protein [Carex littledalei]|uniref:Derlin n=1 Tax=Carex littledalei TaxID=544730 RepID=A0A833QGC5_9POAL|nr:derlin-1-like protein [Carex littledalei]